MLKKNIIITGILESESNQLSATDKFTRVDILAEDDAGTKFIIEVQNTYQNAYLQRMLYSASKTLVESFQSGEEYETLRKVISINILYYDFKGGKGCIYRGKSEFINDDDPNDELVLTEKEKELYRAERPSDLLLEFIIVALSNFDGRLKEQIDAWMYLFINDKLPKKPGIRLSREVKKAEKVVHELLLNEDERKAHDYYLDQVRTLRGSHKTAYGEGLDKGLQQGRAEGLQEGKEIGKAEGLQEGELKGKLMAAKAMLKMNIAINMISTELGLSVEELKELL
ncbi:MAG: Rpn family recombination-promoting nuclease/putative transposase [Chitinophagia bacterium]|nr:Rpn family recombination-promoting nuclease/putative transposase [Chitinophagia bacterium]